MSLIHRIFAWCWVLLAACGWQLGHAADPTPGLMACAQLGENLERLSCFDRLTQQLLANTGHETAPRLATAPEMFGARPPAEPPGAQADKSRAQLKSISAHVADMHERPRGGALLSLDNGQKWQQLGTEDLLLKVGDGVKISRGAFDSFILMTDGNRVTHVKRIE